MCIKCNAPTATATDYCEKCMLEIVKSHTVPAVINSTAYPCIMCDTPTTRLWSAPFNDNLFMCESCDNAVKKASERCAWCKRKATLINKDGDQACEECYEHISADWTEINEEKEEEIDIEAEINSFEKPTLIREIRRIMNQK